ncbi:MAG: cytochrome b [Tepidamorphaceae bacterium]|nr:cytochrome b [Nitratireductor sp.]MCC0048068.1 cytochrome b [Rhodobiaceae bacterium]
MSDSLRAAYTAVSRYNHWIIAFAIIGMLAFGLYLDEAELERSTKVMLVGLHKSIGFLILLFGFWRVGWRLREGFPDAVPGMPRWQEIATKAMHWALLVGILAIPASGMAMSLGGGHAVDVFGLFTIPSPGKVEWLSSVGHVVHGLGSKVLIGLIALHTIGAFKHHFVDKDTTLVRMTHGGVTGEAA